MFDPAGDVTRPSLRRSPDETRPTPARRRRSPRSLLNVLPGVVLATLVALFLLRPDRQTILILGTDRRIGAESPAARSDTLILATFLPLQPYVGLLSIPRDLWVEIPGYGPNRINAALFLAEADDPGSGPAAAVATVRSNFGVDIDGYLLLEFGGLVRFVDALGGVVVDLPSAMAGYPAGPVRLDGKAALAFVRDRKGTDDFFRMERGQLFVRAVLRRAANPLTWPRWPGALLMLLTSAKTDVPPWDWPSLALALLRAGAGGIDGRAIDRSMVEGFVTEGGAQVLAPDWSLINPVLLEMFGQ